MDLVRNLYQFINSIPMVARLQFAQTITSGIWLIKRRRYIKAVTANEVRTSCLGVLNGAPLIMLDNVSLLEDGKPNEYYHTVHKGYRTRFEVE